MEIFPYIFSVLLTALVIHWSRANALRKTGTKVTGLFRYRENLARPVPRASRFTASGASTVRR